MIIKTTGIIYRGKRVRGFSKVAEERNTNNTLKREKFKGTEGELERDV